MLVAETAFAARQALPPAPEAAAEAEEEEAMPPPFTGPIADLGAYEAALQARAPPAPSSYPLPRP